MNDLLFCVCQKRQKKVVEQDKKNQDVVSRKPVDRPQRSAAQVKSYIEFTDSDSESETAQPPPAKACFFVFLLIF